MEEKERRPIPTMQASTVMENSTRLLVFTSASGCRARENFDISSENYFFSIHANIFCDAGQEPILKNFEACSRDVNSNSSSILLNTTCISPSAGPMGSRPQSVVNLIKVLECMWVFFGSPVAQW